MLVKPGITIFSSIKYIMSKVPLDKFKFPRHFLVYQISIWGRAPTSYLVTISPQVVLRAQRPLTYLHQVFSPQRILRNAV